MYTTKNICLFVFLFELFSIGYGERTKDKMYEEITSAIGCYRRLNATHQIGCSSRRGGSTGVVHFCEKEEDLSFILSNGTAPPYIPILPVKLFNLAVVQKLIDSKKVSGLILHLNNESLSHFTHENQCPNPQSSLADTCRRNSVWNPYGSGLLYMDIPFPIFYVEDENQILKMKKCFRKFNDYSYSGQTDRSLCSLELNSFMFATIDTPTCRRRSNLMSNLNPQKICDPLGDSNIWASLYPLVTGSRFEPEPVKGYKFIVLAARIDTTSMFEKTSGANSPITGLVTLLSLAKYLKEILPENSVMKVKKNILFFIFNGETYDYIGSQRMVYDMLQGDFPVKDSDVLPLIQPSNISLFIELSQLGNARDKKLYVHYLKSKSEITDFYTKLSSNSAITFEEVPSSLPPASLHTFLQNEPSMPGLIISDHQQSYNNHFYNSIYDNAANIGFKYILNSTENNKSGTKTNSLQHFIANTTKAIGDTIYEIITNTKLVKPVNVDIGLINELFYCYIESPNCKVFQGIQKGKLPKMPFSLYVGVDHVVSYYTSLTALSLGWFVGDAVGESNINCTNKPKSYAYKFYNMSRSIYDLNSTKCFRMTMNTTEAVSPAFKIPDYDWSSGNYSSWTESVWSEMNVRMFLKPSSAHEKMTIAIGSISVIFSFVLVYFFKSRSHILFTPPLPTEAPADC